MSSNLGNADVLHFSTTILEKITECLAQKLPAGQQAVRNPAELIPRFHQFVGFLPSPNEDVSSRLSRLASKDPLRKLKYRILPVTRQISNPAART